MNSLLVALLAAVPLATGALAADNPDIGRGHGGMTYVNWTLGVSNMTDLTVDITFHVDPQPKAAVYLQLYDFKIGDTPQYFGFQYTFDDKNRPETRFIWSRWGTRDKEDARVAKGGAIESGGYEGDFVGIRFPYAWSNGAYTVQVRLQETDARGAWYALTLYNHGRKESIPIGSLRFPLAHGGTPFIEDGGGSWCEVFGGTRTSADIGYFHMSYDGVYTRGRTVAAKAARFSYGKDTPNCDISPDPNGRRVHVTFGGKTRRQTPAGTYPLTGDAPGRIGDL